MSVDPHLVREALQLGIIARAEARRYLDLPPAPRRPWIEPKSVPPPERLKAVIRPDRRITRPRARRTKALVIAGLIPHHRPPNEEPL